MSAQIERKPIYFGDDSRALFGWLHLPADRARDLAVVICPPIGHEYINSHRSLRHLADALARGGMPALRFDYDGVGDSAGGDDDPDRVAAWQSSVRHALNSARELTGCTRIAAVGVRMGATLAALASADAPLDALALWAPCVRGRNYVRELKALALTGSNRNANSDEGVIEPGGFVFTADTQSAIACINVAAAPPNAKRILIAARDDIPDDGQLLDAWKAQGKCVEQIATSGFAQMMDVPHNTVVPTAAIERIVEWFAGLAGECARPVSRARVRDSLAASDYRESIVHVAQPNGFFGILCEPVRPRGGPLALLPNAGATHHVGPNRLYVALARDLAQAGFRSLRFDLPGLGDNPLETADGENDPYVPSASAVVASAVAAMKQRRAAERFVLMGLCSGAHTSFHAALDLDDPSIAECVLINPLTFYYKAGMSLDQPASNHYEEWQRYMRSMRSLSGWAKLLRDDVKLASIARNVALRFRDIAWNKVTAIRESVSGNSTAAAKDNLDADVRRFGNANRRLTFVFSRFDPGYDLLMINAGRAVKKLSKRGLLDLWRIENATHTFEAKRSRNAMISSIASHLSRIYPQ